MNIIRNKKGFTLVELLAVIVILAVIMIVTISPIITNMYKAKESSFNTAGKSIKKYLKSNYDNCKLSKNNLNVEYDEEIFDENCRLKEEDNLSEILMKNAGYKSEDIKEIEIWSDDEGNFELTISAKEKGKFDGVSDYESGSYCWKTQSNGDGTYKLTKFYGIKNDGSIKEVCSEYVKLDNDGFYEVIIPSTIKELNDRPITVIGNKLFNSLESISVSYLEPTEGVKIPQVTNIDSNHYAKIKKITISDGIKEIEDVNVAGDNLPDLMETPFSGIGIQGIEISGSTLDELEIKLKKDFSLDVSLPGSLTKIGNAAFFASSLEEIVLPSSVSLIGQYSFAFNVDLKKITFNDGLKRIDSSAFFFTKLEKIDLPQTIEEIGKLAFYKTDISSLKIPSSVETIGESSFANNKKLKKIIFGENSNLKKIENLAFNYSSLTYDKSDPLVLPDTLNFIGKSAFGENPNLLAIRFNGTLNDNSINWYDPSVTTLNP